MPHIVETGTDVASLLVFDPSALPENFDQLSGAQQTIVRKLHDEQRVFLVETGADGRYLVHAFVDECVPDYLKPFVREACSHEQFHVLSGRVYCTGLEYAFRVDDSRLRGYPHMGGYFSVPPGRYRLTIYRTEYPDQMMENELRQNVDPFAFALHQNMGCFIGLALAAVAAAVGAFFWGSTALWAGLFLPIAVLFVAVPFIVPRLSSYRRTEQCWNNVQRRYPSLVVEFNRV